MTYQRTMTDIPIGAPVFARDGEQLGTVKEVRGTAFKVGAALKPDYWLPTSALTPSTGRLLVEATKDRIADLTVDEPKGAKAPKGR
jgi:rRNA processing protein Gar1